MTRRFEFVGGTSAKFWEIAAAGKQVWIRFGRLGTGGQSQSKSFSNAEAAAKHVEKLIAAKAAKGYVECVVHDCGRRRSGDNKAVQTPSPD